MKPEGSVNIDNNLDFELAEILLNKKLGKLIYDKG